MAEYIKVSDAIDWFRPYSHMEESIPFDVLVTDLQDSVPAADVAPVVHGRWVNVLLHREKPIRMDALCTLCSNCKKESDRTAFCPHCGAKMDKDGAQK